MHSRFILGLLAIVMAGQMACVDPLAGTASGDTALYVHAVQSGAAKIQVFTDTAGLFSGSGEATASRTLTSSFLNQALPLAWGGMVLNPQGNSLYVIGEAGTVVRITRLRNQTGDIPSTSQDAVSFLLGQSSDRLSGGKFGQAALDTSTGALYVTEANDSESRIWVVSNPASIAQGATVPRQTLTLTLGDRGGAGVTAGQGVVYGFFKEGNPIELIDAWTGPRLRQGTGNGFALLGSVIGGASTQLGLYGTLALDTGNNLLYVARHNEASNGSGNPILVFRSGQFAAAPNQTPDRFLGNQADIPNLRMLSHAGNKDWLGGLSSTFEQGSNFFWLWKNPAAGGDPVVRTLTAGTEIRGLAFDGNN